jgi:hypothetical protein
VIYFEDHLIEETHSDDSCNELISAKNNSEECEILSFPETGQIEVTREEIGKWVDKLMQMPEDLGLDEEIREVEDPLTVVAEKILKEEIF